MQNNLLEIGKIVRSHGIKGNVKIVSYLESVDFSIFKEVFLGMARQPAKITSVQSLNHDAFSVKFDIIHSVEETAKYINNIVYIDRSSYPDFKDKIYLSDILGVDVYDEAGEVLGTFVDFDDYGSATVLSIKTGAVTYAIPFVDEIINYDEEKGGFVMTRQTFLDMRV